MEVSTAMFDKTLHRLRRVWSEISNSLRSSGDSAFAPDLSDMDLERLKGLIDRSLAAQAGEVSARALAANIGERYLSLNETGRERFLRLIARDYGIDLDAVERLLAGYEESKQTDRVEAHLRKLHSALTPPRVQLLTQLNSLPEGVKFLVDMRAELLELKARSDPELAPLEADLKDLLANWFDIGFLKLEHVTWQSPAAFLEKLIAYEAVHEISSWDDLKHRLADDRRLYTFIHPNMPDEPLIFVQIALVKGLATNIQTLLDLNTSSILPKSADTAIFYSISNAQKGLAGISFGNHLIKRVVADLSQALPGLKQFSTLSPLPGFRSWLEKLDSWDSLADLPEKTREDVLLNCKELGLSPSLKGLLEYDGWFDNKQIRGWLQTPLQQLCATYLTSHRKAGGRVLDAVAHFHLSNGASLHQINWSADNSPKGLRESCGLMANYLYDLKTIDQNTQGYTEAGDVSCSQAVNLFLAP